MPSDGQERLGSGWSILNGSLFATTVTGVVEWTGSAVVANRYYYITIKVGSLQQGELRLRIGGVTKTITTEGDYEYKIYTTNTDAESLAMQYPEFYNQIITNKSYISSSPYITMIRYHDKDQDLIYVPDRNNLILSNLPNAIGKCHPIGAGIG